MWNISNIWVAGQQKMQDLHDKLNPGLPWQKHHLTRRRFKCKEGNGTVLDVQQTFVRC